MNNRLFINISSNVVAFTSSLLVSFVITPYLIEKVGKEAYSFFPLSNNILGYFSIASLALNSMMARFITIERERGNTEKAQAYFSSGFFSNIIMAIIFMLPMIIFTVNIDRILNVPYEILFDVQLLFACVFGAMLINLVGTSYGVATFAANRLDLRALGELIRGFLRIVLFFVLFYFLEPSLYIIGMVSFILSVYLFIFQKHLSRKLTPDLTISYSNFEMKSTKELLTSGSWNVVNAIGMSLLLGMTLILTNKFIGVEQGGEVAIALMLPTFVSSIISMIVSVLLPRLTKIYSKGCTTAFSREVIFSQKILSILTTIPVSILIIFGVDFFRLWIPSENTASLPLISSVLLLPLLVHANMWTIYNVNIINNKMKLPSIYLLLTGIISLAASLLYLFSGGENAVAIPAITTFCSVFYYLFYVPIYVVRKTSVRFFDVYINMAKSFLLAFLFVLFSFEIKRFFYINWWSDLFLLMFVFGVVGFIIHAVLLFSFSDIKRFFGK